MAVPGLFIYVNMTLFFIISPVPAFLVKDFFRVASFHGRQTYWRPPRRVRGVTAPAVESDSGFALEPLATRECVDNFPHLLKEAIKFVQLSIFVDVEIQIRIDF